MSFPVPRSLQHLAATVSVLLIVFLTSLSLAGAASAAQQTPILDAAGKALQSEFVHVDSNVINTNLDKDKVAALEKKIAGGKHAVMIAVLPASVGREAIDKDNKPSTVLAIKTLEARANNRSGAYIIWIDTLDPKTKAPAGLANADATANAGLPQVQSILSANYKAGDAYTSLDKTIDQIEAIPLASNAVGNKQSHWGIWLSVIIVLALLIGGILFVLHRRKTASAVDDLRKRVSNRIDGIRTEWAGFDSIHYDAQVPLGEANRGLDKADLDLIKATSVADVDIVDVYLTDTVEPAFKRAKAAHDRIERETRSGDQTQADPVASRDESVDVQQRATSAHMTATPVVEEATVPTHTQPAYDGTSSDTDPAPHGGYLLPVPDETADDIARIVGRDSSRRVRNAPRRAPRRRVDVPNVCHDHHDYRGPLWVGAFPGYDYDYYEGWGWGFWDYDGHFVPVQLPMSPPLGWYDNYGYGYGYPYMTGPVVFVDNPGYDFHADSAYADGAGFNPDAEVFGNDGAVGDTGNFGGDNNAAAGNDGAVGNGEDFFGSPAAGGNGQVDPPVGPANTGNAPAGNEGAVGDGGGFWGSDGGDSGGSGGDGGGYEPADTGGFTDTGSDG